MRQTSYVWNELVENGEFHMDAVARIYGATGTDPDAVSGSDSDGSYREYVKITSPVINRSLLSGNILSIGNCVSGTLNFSIMTTDSIPKSAKIKIMGRVTDGKDENPVQSDWLTFGTFWVDHRTVDDDFIDLECYDAMKMGNQLYDDPTPSAQWPRAVSTIVTRIAQQIGVSIDSRTTKYFSDSGLWGQKIVTMPTSDTLNDILGHIGGILGGNWYITEENKLRYIPLISAPVDAGHILSHANDKITTDQGDYIIHGSISTREANRDGGHITSHVNDKIISHVGDYIMWETLSGLNTIVNLGGTGCVVVPVIVGSMTTADSVSITRVTVSVNADTTYSYGVDGGFELIVSENPYATDALTAALYERVKGVVYSPYNITTAVYNPATELGDWVIAGDVVSSTIFTQNIRIGIGFDADISAPGENELENEFPYKTIEQKVTEKIETTETTLRQETVSAVESATNQITGANGSQIQFLYDENKIMKEIVIMDTNSTSTAQKVWRWNGNGFGYSKNGYNGPYGLAITQDGAIVADFLTVGIIKSPTNADTFWNLSKGELKIKGTGDTSPAIHVKTYMDGDVEKTKTEINADKITTGTFNADGNSVKIRGKLTDWNNSSGNYWNLDTGDFQVKGSSDADYAIKVSNGITNINASKITVGTISASVINNNSIPKEKLSGTVSGGLANRNPWQINFNTGTINIGDISANSVVTGEIKNESNRNNYWNLNTGELKVGSTESPSDYAIKVERLTNQQGNYYWVTNINADKITTGEIKNKSNRNNYWNLNTGEFRLGSTETSSDYAIKVERKQNQQGNYYWTTDINANSIKVGELKNASNRYNYWNLETGEFRLGKDANSYAVKVTRYTDLQGNYVWETDINANSIRAGELKNRNNNNNYWNLDTGDFQVKGSSDTDYAISVSNGITNINAANITTGTLKNRDNNNNYWNLTNGTFKVQGSGDTVAAIEVNSNGKAVINASKITTGIIQAPLKQGQTVNTFNKWNLETGELKVGKSDSDYAIWVKNNGDAIINANKISTGTISANLIQGGTLKLGGTNNTDGVLNVYRADGNSLIGYWDNSGLTSYTYVQHGAGDDAVEVQNSVKLKDGSIYLYEDGSLLGSFTNPDTKTNTFGLVGSNADVYLKKGNSNIQISSSQILLRSNAIRVTKSTTGLGQNGFNGEVTFNFIYSRGESDYIGTFTIEFVNGICVNCAYRS